jgi:hypothetical protein
MPTGIPEGPIVPYFAGIIVNPIISFIMSLIIVGPILLFWAVPNFTAWCIIYGIVALWGIRGAILGNKIIRERGED